MDIDKIIDDIVKARKAIEKPRKLTPEEEAESNRFWEAFQRGKRLKDGLQADQIKINWHSHMRNGENMNPYWSLGIYEVYDDGRVNAHMVNCYTCGEVLHFTWDGGDTVECTTECTKPEGWWPYDIEIDIPSGRFIADDDLRWCTSKEARERGAEAYVNHDAGIVEMIEAFRSDNLGIFFVGNSCPAIYHAGKDRFIFGHLEDYEGDDDEDEPPLTKEELQLIADSDEETIKVGSICTDLWWVSILDYDQFAAACRHEGKDPEEVLKHRTMNVIDVTPGRYRITYRGRGDDSRPEIFATMQRIGDCSD